MSTNRDPVRFEISDGVGTLTFDRPAALNALDFATIDRLNHLLREAATSDDVRAMLLTGSGRAFCAGGDVKEMLRATGEEGVREAMLAGVSEIHEVILALYRMPKPVVAAINGPAAGAGVGLALTADIVWAAESASFTLAFTALGVSPDSGTTFLLPRAVGAKAAAELLLTSRKLTAQEALEIGLVSRLLGDDELLPAARQLARQLAHGPTRAYAKVKSLLRSSAQCDLADQLENERRNVGESVDTVDFAEGLRAFVEKRPARFLGR